MRLSTISSQFVFNLPSTFLPTELVAQYNEALEKNWIQYSNVTDYLNSTIKSINYPGLSMETPEQIRMRGKKINFKPVTNVHDILTTRDLTVTFRSVDSDLNYMMLWEICQKHYMALSSGNGPSNIEHHYLDPFVMKVVDIHRDVIYTTTFRELIFKSLDDTTFDYSEQSYNNKEFSVVFTFNWIEVDFNLTKSKILDLSGNYPVIQQIGTTDNGYTINPFGR